MMNKAGTADKRIEQSGIEGASSGYYSHRPNPRKRHFEPLRPLTDIEHRRRERRPRFISCRPHKPDAGRRKTHPTR